MNNIKKPNIKKVALVTGASRGIGLAVAKALQASGHYVYGTATSQAGVDRIDLELAGSGSGLVLQAEDRQATQSVFKRIADNQHTPLILVNNLACTRDGLLMRMKEEDWQQVIEVNLNSLYRMCRDGLRAMVKARWGRIINMASVVAMMGNPGQCNYTASKAGMIGFSRSLAKEVASRGITVNCIAPGFIDTDMTAQLSEQQRTDILGHIPAKRFGQADEVAALVNFLASEPAAYITGETITINGGLYMR